MTAMRKATDILAGGDFGNGTPPGLAMLKRDLTDTGLGCCRPLRLGKATDV